MIVAVNRLFLFGSFNRSGTSYKKKEEKITMIKEIEIQGCVTVPEEVSMDNFIDKFIAFIEENDWSFGGGYRTIADGHYINDDGEKGEYVLDN